MLQRLFLMTPLLAIAACASVGDSSGDADVVILDASDATDADADAIEDTAPEVDIVEDIEPDARPGGFGEPCTEGSDCASGYCIESATGGLICTQFCVDECPDEDYECRLIGNTGGDLVNICFPRYEDLCRECDLDRQCGGLSDRCVQLLDGRYCARDCSTDDVCPEGFLCTELQDGGKQCIPESQTCSSCADPDLDLHGIGPGCLGGDCDQENAGVFEGAPELCDRTDNDCDNEIDEGFDFNTNPDHCSGCNMACELDNAIPGCSAGTCFISECEDGYYDLNADPEDGCEYFCEFEDLEVEDRPDYQYRDTNCDGIDGDPARAIFVARSGDDGNLGTPGEPVRTIERGIELAGADPFVDSVYIAEGEYFGPPNGEADYWPFEIVDGINLYGGYENGTWRRSPDNDTRLTGARVAAMAVELTLPTELGGLHFIGADGRTRPGEPGETSIGLWVEDSENLTITGCTIRGGAGGNGAPGEAGDPGFNAAGGTNGNTGEVSSGSIGCNENPSPDIGVGGASTCGNRGGNGGAAGRSESDGRAGSPGTGPTGGPGGGGGAGGEEDWTTATDEDGEPGDNGTVGGAGDDGDAGAAGAAENVFVDDLWVAGNGAEGTAGTAGSGGGGGGGGGGAPGGCGGFTDTCDGYGGSGGGGGGGGCGGDPGLGGYGGGSSFGLYVIDSIIAVRHSDIRSGLGGAGGAGGDGGNGGNGGDPGIGGGSSCDGGDGGNGGRGGDGGDGGDGGGGAGGSSVPLVTVRSTDIIVEDTLLEFGAVGVGGTGGTPGEDGIRREIVNLD